jgi:hypothetical protein
VTECMRALREAADGDAIPLADYGSRQYFLADRSVVFGLAPRVRYGRAELARVWARDEDMLRPRPDEMMWRMVYDRDFFRLIQQNDDADRAQAIMLAHYRVMSDPKKALAILVAEDASDRVLMVDIDGP